MGSDKKIHCPLLENAGAHALLDVVARARFKHNRFDAFKTQQMRQQESRRTRSDDPHLRSHFLAWSLFDGIRAAEFYVRIESRARDAFHLYSVPFVGQT